MSTSMHIEKGPLTLPSFQSVLREELKRRVRQNPRYSLRSFAKQLQFSPSYLSMLLSGKRDITLEAAKKIALGLKLEKTKRAELLLEVTNHLRDRKSSPRKKPAHGPTSFQMKALAADLFELISDWHHYAILELTELPDFSPDPNWIASQLRIPLSNVILSVERLQRIGALEKTSTGSYTKSNSWFTTTHEIPDQAIRKYHRQVLQLASASIDRDPVQERDMSAITFAVDQKKIPEAKAMIRRFRRRMAEFLSKGTTSRVYKLSLQLFPVSNSDFL